MSEGTYEPIVAAILAAATLSPKPSLDRAPFDMMYNLEYQSGPEFLTNAGSAYELTGL